MTFPTSVQLTKRVRDPQRLLLFVEKGNGISKYLEKDGLLKVLGGNNEFLHSYVGLLTKTLATLAAKMADVLNNNDILWIFDRNPKLLDKLDENGESKRVWMRGKFISLVCSGSDISETNHNRDGSAANVGVDDHVDSDTDEKQFQEMSKKCASIFWSLKLEYVKGICQMVRYPENDNSISKTLESVDCQNSVAIRNIETCAVLRSSLCNDIGKRCVATFRVIDRCGSAPTSDRERFAFTPRKR